MRRFICLLVLITSTTSLPAQFDFTAATVPGTPGSLVQVAVTLMGSDEIRGYRFGLLHDPAHVTLVNVAAGSDVTIGNFTGTITFPNDGFGNTLDGGTAVWLFDPFNPVPLAPNTLLEVAVFTYDVAPTASGTIPITFTSMLDAGMLVDINVSDSTGQPTLLAVNTTDGAIELGGGSETFGLTAASDIGLPGSVVSIPVTVSNTAAIDGCSFGITHDPTVAFMTGITLDPSLPAVQFMNVQTNVTTGGSTGGTVAIGFDLMAAPMGLPAGTDQPLCGIDYELIGLSGDMTSLDFCDECLGTPGMDLTVVYLGNSVAPDTTSGLLEIDFPPVEFIRGDANDDGEIELADAMFIARYLFLGAMPPGCFDAADANDDGDVTLPDAVLIFMYITGQAPGTLAEVCDVDDTDDTLDCAAYNSCP